MMKKITLVVLLALSLVTAAFAAPIGANVTVGSADSLAVSGIVGNTTINGGEVKSVNVNNTFSTTKWAGFYGNITAGLALGDSSGNEFYSWTVTDVTDAMIYAANATTSFTGLVAGNATVYPSYLTGAATDNYTNTFIGNEAITAGTTTANGITADFATTNSGGTLKTYALVDNVGTYILAGQAQEATTAFNSDEVDFQILAPAQSGTEYFFYVELP